MGVCTHIAKEPIASPVLQWYHPWQELNFFFFGGVLGIDLSPYIHIQECRCLDCVYKGKERRDSRQRECSWRERSRREGGRKERASLTSRRMGHSVMHTCLHCVLNVRVTVAYRSLAVTPRDRFASICDPKA